MSSLIDAAQESRLLEQLLEETGGEMSPDVERWFDNLQNTIADKVDAYNFVMTRLDANADALRKQASIISNAARTIENAQERMRARIKMAMQTMGTTELRGAAFRFKLTPSAPKLIIDDEAKVPAEYKTPVTVIKIETDALKKAIKDGAAVQGAHIETGDTLRTYANTKGTK